jgi:RNA-directed DNA polymerase
MITASISLQDLQRRLYVKAKAEKDWRFWGLYVHVSKLETRRAAYAMAKQDDGAPGIDGVTFEAIEAAGVEPFLAQLRDELVSRTYRPLRNRRVEIPKEGGKVRVLGIPAIRDRVVQGALKHILEPIFEADFHDGSYGYRPKWTAQQAVDGVAEAIVRNKTRVIDVDLAGYFDSVRHDLLLVKVARRVNDRDILHVLKRILKAAGKRGVPQGGVVSPLLSNIYLTEVDAMLERAKAVTANGQRVDRRKSKGGDSSRDLARATHACRRDVYLRRMASQAAGNGTLGLSMGGGGWRASSENHQARSAPQPSPAGSGS